MVRAYVAICRLLWLFLAAAAFPATGQAQRLVPNEETASVNSLFENRTKQNTLKCYIDTRKPSVDFSLENVVGYSIGIPLPEVHVGEKVVAYVRVKPTGGEPVLLKEDFEMPPPKSKLPEGKWELRAELSGSLALGEGSYAVELLALDENGRTAYKRWDASVGAWPEHAVPPRLKPLKVAAVTAADWDGNLDARGPCVNFLLNDTAPNTWDEYLPSNFFWARGVQFAREALPTLLEELSPQTVRVVAFNLDQQSEVFRSENFGAAGLSDLHSALKDTGPPAVPDRVVESSIKFEYLSKLVQEQGASSCQTNVVVILGPRMGWDDTVPKGIVDTVKTGSSRLFYFQSYGDVGLRSRDAPDAIEHLVLGVHGTVFHIHAGRDFAVSIQSMLDQVRTKTN